MITAVQYGISSFTETKDKNLMAENVEICGQIVVLSE